MIHKEIKQQNQLHPPRRKYPGEVDEGANKKKKVWYKDGNSTMLFCKGLTTEGSKVLIQAVKDTMNKLGTDIEGHFLITQ